MTEVIPFKKPALQNQLQEPLSFVLKKCQWQLLITIVVSLVVHFLFFGDYYYTFDDSYVFHVYARNLANGYGFSFNPGEISHAATPLLTFILAIQHFLFGGAALISAKFINLGFSLSAAVILFLIAYRISGNDLIALGTALVWAASPLEAEGLVKAA